MGGKIIFFKIFMAGIYIHIPFCATKCIYCDFFSVAVTAEKRSAYLAALSKEYDARLGELQGEEVGTLYIGGGTPSLLSVDEIAGLVSMPVLSADAEVTVEVNPDDVTPDFVDGLKRAGVNRVSMGVQSFCDEELEFLRRRHNAAQAKAAVATLRDGGIVNLSIDLIYGIPGQSVESWTKSLEEAVDLNTPHVSAYSLTYEEGTRLTRMRDRGDFSELDDDLTVALFEQLAATLHDAGYEQYEISNLQNRDGIRGIIRHIGILRLIWDLAPRPTVSTARCAATIRQV